MNAIVKKYKESEILKCSIFPTKHQSLCISVLSKVFSFQFLNFIIVICRFNVTT